MGKPLVPLNSETMKWARIAAGYPTVKSVVDSLPPLKNKKNGEADLIQWETGNSEHKPPSVGVLKALAKKYGLPDFMALCLPLSLAKDLVPNIDDIRDFRTQENAHKTPELIQFLRNAKKRQLVLRQFVYEKENKSLSWKKRKEVPENPEEFGLLIHKTIWGDKNPTPNLNAWINAAENNLGIAVLQFYPHYTRDIGRQISGVALDDDILPVVVLNVKDSKERRIFTLLHEIAHLFIGSPGISQINEEYEEYTPDRRIEQQCDRAAEASLMPQEKVKELWDHTKEPQYNIKAMKNNLGCSEMAGTVRAGRLNLLTPDEVNRLFLNYQASFRESQKQKKTKSSGGGQVHPKFIARGNTGPRILRRALSAFDEWQIDYDDLYNVLEVKLDHLPKIAELAEYSLFRWDDANTRLGKTGSDGTFSND